MTSPRDFSPVLMDIELDALQRVREAKKAPSDPTVLMILFHAVERLAEEALIKRQIALAQARAIRGSIRDIERVLPMLNLVADDILSDQP